MSKVIPIGGQAANDTTAADAVGHSAGRMDGTPIVGVALLCVASLLAGAAIDHRFLQRPPAVPKVAFAEQGAVVLEAVLERPDLESPAARQRVGQALRGVIDKYQHAGYVVLDATHAPDHQVVVDAVPASAIDITAEMRQAIALATSSSASSPWGAHAGTGEKQAHEIANGGQN